MSDTYDPEWESYKRNWSKRYLGRVRATVHTVTMLRSEIAELEAALEGLQGIDYSKDHIGGTDAEDMTIERIERLDSLRAEYAAELEDNLSVQALAHRALSHVGQPMRAVLTYRYLEGKAWTDVVASLSDDKKYSEEYCRKELHDKGLIDLYPFIPHEFDELPDAF